MADIHSQVTTQLDADNVKSILDGVALGMVHRAKVHDPAMVEGNQHLDKKYVSLQAAHWLKCMYLTGPKPKEKTKS